VDGDLIEQFLELNRESMDKVAQEMGGDVTVEEISKRVEDMARLH
jgi:DNA damage-binding protein 1